MLDPNGGCTGLECTIDTDCSFNKACVAYRCRDPCPGSCGIGASCRVEKHHPVCTCNHELTGNPLIRCFEISKNFLKFNLTKYFIKTNYFCFSPINLINN